MRTHVVALARVLTRAFLYRQHSLTHEKTTYASANADDIKKHGSIPALDGVNYEGALPP